MDELKRKELYKHLQYEMEFDFSLYDSTHRDTKTLVKLYNKIDDLRNPLLTALQLTYPDPPGWESVKLIDLQIDWGQIAHANDYYNQLLNLIKYIKTEGYFLELIAAAHKHKKGNPYMRDFIQDELKSTILEIQGVVLVQTTSPVPMPLRETESVQPPRLGPISSKRDYSPKTNDWHVQLAPGANGHNRNNGYSLKTSMPEMEIRQPRPGPSTNEQNVAQTVPLAKPALPGDSLLEQEAQTDVNPHQEPLPFPNKASEEVFEPSDVLIALAYQHIRSSRSAIQLVQNTLAIQDNEDDLILQISEVRENVEAIPTPDDPNLYYRVPGKQKLFVEVSREVAYSLQAKKVNNAHPRFLQQTFRRLEKLLTLLQELEDIMQAYELQVKQSERTNNLSIRNGK